MTRALFLFTLYALLVLACGHEGHNDPSPPCEKDQTPIRAPFAAGLLTVDGDSADWDSIEGRDFVLHQAVLRKLHAAYPNGSLLVKAAHDGHSLFILLQVPGAYAFNSRDSGLAPSVALMFGIGDDATYYNMGGCSETKCDETKCRGHEVDLVHFTLQSAIPGRQYGSNFIDNSAATGKDSFGNLDDMFGWSAHCQHVDGLQKQTKNYTELHEGGSQNDWQGSWSHSSMDLQYGLVGSDAPYSKLGEDGLFTFEFRRPLRTNDLLQQDIQLKIGGSHRFGAAFWYPENGVQWSKHEHYVLSCDWLSLDLLPASEGGGYSNGAAAGISALAMVLSLAAIIISLTVGWWVKSNTRQFTPMEISM